MSTDTDDNNSDDVERSIEFGTLAEQKDESHYDHRDDSEKGRLSFPKNKLYGREDELEKLHSWYSSLQAKNSNSSMYVFLGGYSGTGKSALVDEFIKQIASKRDNKSKNTCYISAKFGQLKSGRPFAALSQAIDQYILDLASASSKQDLEPLRASLAEVDITLGSEYETLLSDVLMPGLKVLLHEELRDSSVTEKLQRDKQEEEDSFTDSVPRKSRYDSNVEYDMNVIKYAFQNFIKTVAAYCKPLIIFMDDLQWADDASFQLLSGLLKGKPLRHILLIGAFRVNEVDGRHPWTKLMMDVEAQNGLNEVKKFEVFNLSPAIISKFIADTIHREVEDVALIADVIYTKTLGNIFFVKQALEELVRKNALYFDVICYQWQFGDVTRVELENFLSNDVVDMVLSKLKTLPKSLQTALALAAYTNSTFQFDLLEALLSAKSVLMEPDDLRQMMVLAYKEGLVVHANSPALSRDVKQSCYKFVHDHIREAACALVPAGDERDQFLLCIANVLLDHASPGKDDWMLFTAASHFNSLPVCVTDPIELAKLNLTVGKIASSRGSFYDAAVFLRAGVDRLPASCWKDKYSLSLELKNCLMDAEQFLGNADKVLEIAGEICQEAKNLLDKSRAHFHHLEASTRKSNFDYAQAAIMALDILVQYGTNVPKYAAENNARFAPRRSKSNRNLHWHCIEKFPIAKDLGTIASMRLATMALTYVVLGKQEKSQSGLDRVADTLQEEILSMALANQVITKDMALILGLVGINLRNAGKFHEAVEIANVGTRLMDRFPEDRGVEFLKGKAVLFPLSTLRNGFGGEVHTFWHLHKQLLGKGEAPFSIASALTVVFGYLNASLHLHASFEAKLFQLEEAATTIGQRTYAFEFAVLRQCLYNLQGGPAASSNPVDVTGAASDEEKVKLQFQGVAQRMVSRHISLVRLILAVIFGDEVVMQQMLDQLDDSPIFDVFQVRQHLRLTYTGFAAIILSGRSEKNKKWAKIAMNFFGNLARFGSANGRIVYACMKAVCKPSVSAFNEAIQECTNEGIQSLAALMNEWCGLMLLKQSNNDVEVSGQEYLRCATRLYNDWGASGKVLQLRAKHEFLHSHE